MTVTKRDGPHGLVDERIRNRRTRRPRPASLSEIVRGQLAALAKVRPESSSVELTRNAKGDTQIKVSVSSADGEAIEATAARAQATYDALTEKYAAPK